MKLITKAIRAKLLEEGEDKRPALKLFCPWGAATWLISELHPGDPDILFGLCDLGNGTPELGSVSLTELENLRGPGGLGIERDLHFKPSKTLASYAEEAQANGGIQA